MFGVGGRRSKERRAKVVLVSRRTSQPSASRVRAAHRHRTLSKLRVRARRLFVVQVFGRVAWLAGLCAIVAIILPGTLWAPPSTETGPSSPSIIVDVGDALDADSQLTWFSGPPGSSSPTQMNLLVYLFDPDRAGGSPSAESVDIYFDEGFLESEKCSTHADLEIENVGFSDLPYPVEHSIRAAREEAISRGDDPLKTEWSDRYTRIAVTAFLDDPGVDRGHVLFELRCELNRSTVWTIRGTNEVFTTPRAGMSTTATGQNGTPWPSLKLIQKSTVATNDSFYYLRGGSSENVVESSRSTTWESDTVAETGMSTETERGDIETSFSSGTWPQQAVFGSEDLSARRDLLLVVLGLVAALAAEAAVGLVRALWSKWATRSSVRGTRP